MPVVQYLQQIPVLIARDQAKVIDIQQSITAQAAVLRPSVVVAAMAPEEVVPLVVSIQP